MLDVESHVKPGARIGWSQEHPSTRQAQGKGREVGIEVGGILGLVILIADIWAIVNIFGSSASIGSKVLWIVIVLVLPVIGLILWWLMGPRSR